MQRSVVPECNLIEDREKLLPADVQPRRVVDTSCYQDYNSKHPPLPGCMCQLCHVARRDREVTRRFSRTFFPLKSPSGNPLINFKKKKKKFSLKQKPNKKQKRKILKSLVALYSRLSRKSSNPIGSRSRSTKRKIDRFVDRSNRSSFQSRDRTGTTWNDLRAQDRDRREERIGRQ